jgi:hypothetical protein
MYEVNFSRKTGGAARGYNQQSCRDFYNMKRKKESWFGPGFGSVQDPWVVDMG